MKSVFLFYNNFPVKIEAAIVKYIIRPETSTKVATKGDDAVAGSKPIFRKINGIIAPAIVPHKTIITSEIETVKATYNQNSP